MNEGYLGKEWRKIELGSKNEHEHMSEASKRMYGLPTVRGRRVQLCRSSTSEGGGLIRTEAGEISWELSIVTSYTMKRNLELVLKAIWKEPPKVSRYGNVMNKFELWEISLAVVRTLV